MANLFGDRMDFAIEADVEPDLKPPSAVWGYMCIWCRGVPLGDVEDRHCGLYQAYRGFRLKLSYMDQLWAKEFVGLDDVAIWNHLDGLLYGYHGDIRVPDDRTVEQCQRDATIWGCFDFLTNWGEQFDGYKSFVMRPPGGPIRILSRLLPEGMGRSVEVSRDGFVIASEGFIRWFEEMDRQLRGPQT